jgi:hypothetical protein
MRTTSSRCSLLIAIGMAAVLGCSDGGGPHEVEFFGDDGVSSVCLQEVETNGSARTQGMTVELECHGGLKEVPAPTTTGLVWVMQLTLDLDINKMACDHHMVFWIRNPLVGEAKMSSHFIEDVSTYTGLYSGELGSLRFTNGSSLEITSVDPTVTGRFSVELEDGTVFSDGHFEVTPTR